MRFWMLNRKWLWWSGLMLLGAALAGGWMFYASAGSWLALGELKIPNGAVGLPVTTPTPPETPAATESNRAGPEIFTPAKTDFFVDYRLEREMSRGRQVELLQAVARDAAADEGKRAAAQERLLQISQDLERETKLENIIRAKGFRDAVVFFHDDMVTVVVPDPLFGERSTDIVNLVTRGAGVMPENVMVIGHTNE